MNQVAADPPLSDCNNDQVWSVKSPGNVAVADSSFVSFLNCSFRHLGGAGLDFTRVTDSLISDSLFEDISGSAIQLGSFTPTINSTTPVNPPCKGFADGSKGTLIRPTSAVNSFSAPCFSTCSKSAQKQDVRNVVRNSIVRSAALEYRGAAGINLGYTQNCTLHHNDVSNLTYVGITVGWGWSRHECASCTNAGGNNISYNRVHDYKQVLNDGGGIYMLGPQNSSVIHDNYVYDQHTSSSGALYPDEGSAYSKWYHNVVSNIRGSKWLHLWTKSIHNITVENNFVDTAKFLNHGTNCPMINNHVFKVR